MLTLVPERSFQNRGRYTAATARRGLTSSESSSRARNTASRHRSSAPCTADPPSCRSSAISRPDTKHRKGRNYLWFKHGDANNAVLVTVGYNFSHLISWLSFVQRQILAALPAEP
jgi:hypothetical protein